MKFDKVTVHPGQVTSGENRYHLVDADWNPIFKGARLEVITGDGVSFEDVTQDHYDGWNIGSAVFVLEPTKPRVLRSMRRAVVDGRIQSTISKIVKP